MKIIIDKQFAVTGKTISLTAQELVILAQLKEDLTTLYINRTDATIKKVSIEEKERLNKSLANSTILLSKITEKVQSLKEAEIELFGEEDFDITNIQKVIDHEMKESEVNRYRRDKGIDI